MEDFNIVKYRKNKHGDVVVDVPMGGDEDTGSGDESDDEIGPSSLPFFPTTSMRRNIIRRLSVQRSGRQNFKDFSTGSDRRNSIR